MLNFTTARINMVESQVRPNKVTDPRLIDALETLPREDFVPPDLRAVAYVDRSLKLGEGRYLLDPMVFARLVLVSEHKGKLNVVTNSVISTTAEF